MKIRAANMKTAPRMIAFEAEMVMNLSLFLVYMLKGPFGLIGIKL